MSVDAAPADKGALLEEKLLAARRGRRFWLSLEEGGALREGDLAVLFPSHGPDSVWAIKNLEDFILSSGAESLLVLFTDPQTGALCRKELSGKGFGEGIRYLHVAGQDAEGIMAYYMLDEFTDRLIIASLSLPAGRHGLEAIGADGITGEEAVRIGILGLPG